MVLEPVDVQAAVPDGRLLGGLLPGGRENVASGWIRIRSAAAETSHLLRPSVTRVAVVLVCLRGRGDKERTRV